ncbi:hypothetical protein [Smaragdicoccus niigatensis]|uniref:hypothetical protein n=1 Tax=Smaragdicoccus niigatensis TaxID=359359 RepID=UPI00036CD440|nr:hypothetical protein [Smaragdicoccus niigatensis]
MRWISSTTFVTLFLAASACSSPPAAPAPTSTTAAAQGRVFLTDLLPNGSLSFEPGDAQVGGVDYSHSLVWGCGDGCPKVGQPGQAGQPGIEFEVPDGFDRLEFTAALTDSSTQTDGKAYVAVYEEPELTKLFDSDAVTTGTGLPVSVPVKPGTKIRIDAAKLNGNETVCLCDASVVRSEG